MLFHEDVASNDDNRKKYRTFTVWTNNVAFIKILKAVISKSAKISKLKFLAFLFKLFKKGIE